jgi:macrodomain Ter protein organizer (MatP/YcbG family)
MRKKLSSSFPLSIGKRIQQEALQIWIHTYVSPEKWQRCLLTLRQNKSRKKLKLRRLDLKMDVYLTVKTLAKKLGMSMGDTIFSLAKPKLDKIYQTELANELKLPTKNTKRHK